MDKFILCFKATELEMFDFSLFGKIEELQKILRTAFTRGRFPLLIFPSLLPSFFPPSLPSFLPHLLNNRTVSDSVLDSESDTKVNKIQSVKLSEDATAGLRGCFPGSWFLFLQTALFKVQNSRVRDVGFYYSQQQKIDPHST